MPDTQLALGSLQMKTGLAELGLRLCHLTPGITLSPACKTASRCPQSQPLQFRFIQHVTPLSCPKVPSPVSCSLQLDRPQILSSVLSTDHLQGAPQVVLLSPYCPPPSGPVIGKTQRGHVRKKTHALKQTNPSALPQCINALICQKVTFP